MDSRLYSQLIFLLLFVSNNCNPVIRYSFCPPNDLYCKPTEFGSNTTLIFGDLNHNVYIHKGNDQPPLSVSCTSSEPVRWIFTAHKEVEIQSVKSTVNDKSSMNYYYEVRFREVDSGIIRCESYGNQSRAAEIYVDACCKGPKYRHSGSMQLFYLGEPNGTPPFFLPCILDRYPQDLNLKRMALMQMGTEKFSYGMSKECIRCIRETNEQDDSCSEDGCGPLGISLKMWQETKNSSTQRQNLTVEMDFSEWKACVEDLQCSLSTYRLTKGIPRSDCNLDRRMTCSDRYSVIRSYPNDCGNTTSAYKGFDRIEACMVQTTGKKVEDARFDPRFGFLLQSVAINVIYMCPSTGAPEDVLFASYMKGFKMETDLKLNRVHSNEFIKGLSCQGLKLWQEDDVGLQMIPCNNLFDCETQLETRGFQKHFRVAAAVSTGDPISKNIPGSRQYGQYISEPVKQGATICYGFFHFSSEFVYKINFFFTGVDSESYFIDRFPAAAVIAMTSNYTNESSDQLFSFNCTVATFMVYPVFQFKLHLKDGSTIDIKNLDVDTYKLFPVVEGPESSTQTLIMVTPKTAISLVCSAPSRNSKWWAQVEIEVQSNAESDQTDDISKNNKPNSTTASLNAASIKLIIALSLLSVILVTSVAFGFVFFRRYRTAKESGDLTLEDVHNFIHGNPVLGLVGSTDGGVNLERIEFPVPYRITSPDIMINTHDVLGEGEFGVCVTGVYQNMKVAVKMPKPSVELEVFKEFLKEVKIMAYIGKHANIVQFFGALLDGLRERTCLAICELSPYGDLLQYLRYNSARNQSEKVYMNSIPPVDSEINWKCNSKRATLKRVHLCYFCEQIAAAMEFLVTKRVIHGDLAARNVLVFPDFVVKVSDFGLSRKLYDASNYKKRKNSPLPWRWMAIESLKYMEFSSMADMWSFGITAWEIFSMGKVPYSGATFSNDFDDQLDAGLRLAKPEHATDEIYQFMSITWSSIPLARPTFSNAREFFQGQRQR